MIERLDICPARDEARRTLVVVLQHGTFADLSTVVVAPLVPEGRMKRVARLHPSLAFEDGRWLIAIERLAGVPVRSVGRSIGSAHSVRDEITSALDFLFTGF